MDAGSTATATEPTVPAPAVTVGRDHPCASCGYNLRGLEASSHCPECALPVADSMKGNFLAFAGVPYRAGLIRALSWMLVGIIAQVVVGTSAYAVFMLLARQAAATGTAAFATTMTTAQTAVSIVGIAPYALILAGAWLLVRKDPGYNGPRDPAVARSCTRVCIAGQALCILTPVALDVFAPFLKAGPVTMTIGLLKNMLWIVLFFATVSYVRWLASRVPSGKWVTRAGRYLWLLPMLAVAPVITSVLLLVLVRVATAALLAVYGIISLLSLGCWIAALIAYWSMLFAVRKDIARIHAAAGA